MTTEPGAERVDDRRRALLAALTAGGVAGLAGCPDGDTPTAGDTPTDTEPPTDTATPTERPPESLTFEGLEHTSLGGASLDADDDRLAVSGVGEEGGVRVDFGTVEATSISLAPVDLGEPDRRFDVSGTGTVAGSSGESVGTVSLRGTGETIEATADYSDVGTDRVRVQVVDGGEVVGETVVEGGGTVATVEPGPEGLPQVEGCDKDLVPDPPFPPLPCYVPGWDRPGTVVTPDGTELGSGDRLRLLAEEPERGIDAIESFDLTAAGGVSEFAVTDETVGVFGNDHGAIGGVTLDARSLEPRLTVGDVGDGEGVGVDFGGVGAASVSLAPVDLGERGRQFDVGGTGTVDGESGQSIGGISLRGTGDAVEAVADYSDVGSERVRIQVVDGGEVVGETVVAGGGTVAQVGPGPDGDGPPALVGCDKDVLPDPPFPPIPCYVPVWDGRARVVASDGTELGTGDRLRLLADEPGASLEAVGGFDLAATGVGEFALTGESTEPLEGAVLFEGLQHSALGDASLEVAGDSLAVSGLDREGDDGVRVDFGSVDAASVSLSPVDVGAEGSRFDVRGTGAVGGTAGRSIGGISLRGTGDAVEATADYSDVGTDRVRVQVVRGGEVVGETVVEGGGTVATIRRGPDEDGLPRLDGCDKDLVPLPPQPFPCYVPTWDRLGTVVTPDGTELGSGDRLRLLAEEPERGIDAIETFDLTAGGVSEFRVTEESIGAFGNDHEAVGDATLGARDGGSELTVGNLDGDGGDGVRASFGGVGNAAVDLDPVEVGADQQFSLSGTGTVDGEPGQSIGRVSLRGTGDAVEAVADYSDVGSERVRVEVARDGDVVGSAVVPGGETVASFLPPVDHCEKDLTVPDAPPCYIFGFGEVGPVRTPGGEELGSGDEVRLLAAEPRATVERIGSFQLTGTGLGSMTITGEVPGVER